MSTDNNVNDAIAKLASAAEQQSVPVEKSTAAKPKKAKKVQPKAQAQQAQPKTESFSYNPEYSFFMKALKQGEVPTAMVEKFHQGLLTDVDITEFWYDYTKKKFYQQED